MAAIAGLLLYAAFVPAPLQFLVLAWPLPLLLAIRGLGWRDAARLGYWAGLAFFVPLFWWLIPTVGRFGGFGVVPATPIVLAMDSVLALYFSAWTGLLGWLGPSVVSYQGLLAASAAWALLEWLRSWLFTGLPWGLVAQSLRAAPPLRQWASVLGCYGLGFFVALVGLLVASGLMLGRAGRGRLVAALSLLIVGLAGGGWLEARAKDQGQSAIRMEAAVVQPAIPQEKKWDPSFQWSTLQRYRALTQEAAKGLSSHGLRLLVWPETATPFFFQQPSILSSQVRKMARDAGLPLLFGSPAFESSQRGISYRNRAYLLDQNGTVLGRYDKRHLVPFGEYLPLGPMAPVVARYIKSVGDYSPGNGAAPLELGPLRVGVLICFESVFPWLARQEVDEGANLLVVMTNDAWFGPTEAPYQHEWAALLRAVETGRWVVRAANTGISAIIAPWGEEVARLDLGRKGVIHAAVELRSRKTVYDTIGDLPVIAVLLALLIGTIMWIAPWRRQAELGGPVDNGDPGAKIDGISILKR